MHTALTRLKLQDDVAALAEAYITVQVRFSSNYTVLHELTADAV
jgi:hypothetical protein